MRLPDHLLPVDRAMSEVDHRMTPRERMQQEHEAFDVERQAGRDWLGRFMPKGYFPRPAKR